MISVEHVSKRYRTRQGWRTVLDDINFTLKKGENVGQEAINYIHIQYSLLLKEPTLNLHLLLK